MLRSWPDLPGATFLHADSDKQEGSKVHTHAHESLPQESRHHLVITKPTNYITVRKTVGSSNSVASADHRYRG